MGGRDSSTTGDGAGATLRLRLLHSHGEARDGMLSIPPAGAGMAGALELGGERLSQAQWRAAEQCRIARQGPGWQLLNGNPALVCALNGERVMAHVPMAVSAGDTLELGLLRFVVDGEGAAVASVPPPELAGKPFVRPPANTGFVVDSVVAGEAAEAVDDLFDLRDLAMPSRHARSTDATQGSHLDDPFGVLDIAGAERRTVSDPLAELLGELPSPPTTSAASYADALEVAQHVAAPAPRAGAAKPADLLLTDLHEEFVRVVRDPTQLTGRVDWDSVVSSGDGPPPTLDELSQLAAPYHLLRDILQPRESIDQIIADFDPLHPSTLLDATDTEEVLRLFAPKLAQGAKAAMPSLTRREHHDLSPDSHMDLGAFRPDDKETR